jgi:hypothetical protein
VNGASAGSDDLEVALPHVVETDESRRQDGDATARFSLFELATVGYFLDVLADIPRAPVERDLLGAEEHSDPIVVGAHDD